MRSAFVYIAALFVVCASPIVVADATLGAIAAEIVFSDEEIRVIREYYDERSAKHSYRKLKGRKKSLPPGIARNLERGKPLPPGIAKQVLPTELNRALPPVRDGYQRFIVDGKILLLDVATQTIRDVISDVILH